MMKKEDMIIIKLNINSLIRMEKDKLQYSLL